MLSVFCHRIGNAKPLLVPVCAPPLSTARTLSPCIVLLDNLDMLLGGAGTLQPDSHDGQQQEDSLDTSGTTPTALPVSQKQGSVNHSGGGRKVPLSKGRSKQPFTPRSTRTRHQAVDRMLSTLLVEIDGVYSGQAPEAFADTLGSQYKVPSLQFDARLPLTVWRC